MNFRRSKCLPLSLSPKAVLSQLICATPLTCGLLPRLITVTSLSFETKYSAAYLLTKVVPPVIRVSLHQIKPSVFACTRRLTENKGSQKCEREGFQII